MLVSDVFKTSSSKSSVSQAPGRGPVPGPGIYYSGPREVPLEFFQFNFLSNFMNKCFKVEIF